MYENVKATQKLFPDLLYENSVFHWEEQNGPS